MHRFGPKVTYISVLGGQGLARGLLSAALLSYWVVQARLEPLQLVLLGTAIEATLFAFQVPTGAFADSVGRRPATATGYAILGMGLGLQGLTRDFGWLLALQALSGVGWAFLNGSIEAWIAEHAGTDGLTRVYLRGGQAETVGLMAGLSMTVPMAQLDLRLPIFAGGALLLLVSLAAAVLMTEVGHNAVLGPGSRWRTVARAACVGVGMIVARRTLVLLVAVAVTLGISFEGWNRLYTAHLMRDLGLASASALSPAGALALIGLAQSLLVLAALQLATRRLADSRPGGWLAAVYVSRAAMMLVFAIVPWLPLALAAFLSAETVRRLALPLVDAWVARESPPEVRSTVLSVVGQAGSLGQITAGPVVGLLGNLASVSAALAASAGMMLPAAWLAFRASRERSGVSSPA